MIRLCRFPFGYCNLFIGYYSFISVIGTLVIVSYLVIVIWLLVIMSHIPGLSQGRRFILDRCGVMGKNSCPDLATLVGTG